MFVRVLTSFILAALMGVSCHANEVTVTNASGLQNALDNPTVTVIKLAPGIYTRNSISHDYHYLDGNNAETFSLVSHFRLDVPRTGSLRIESESIDFPAVIQGSGFNSSNVIATTGYALHVFGVDNVTIRDIVFEESMKGIMVDDSNDVVINNCLVQKIGEEGIHVRHGSDDCQILNCTVTDCGINRGEVGEGIYVGTDRARHLGQSYRNSSLGGHYDREVDRTIIDNCFIGPKVRAEHIDVKEGTDATRITNCYFYDDADGIGSRNEIDGSNYSDTFIDLKGINATVANCCFVSTSNAEPVEFEAGIGVSQRGNVPTNITGTGSKIYDNLFALPDSNDYMVRKAEGNIEFRYANNVRDPAAGETYTFYSSVNAILDNSLSNGNTPNCDNTAGIGASIAANGVPAGGGGDNGSGSGSGSGGGGGGGDNGGGVQVIASHLVTSGSGLDDGEGWDSPWTIQQGELRVRNGDGYAQGIPALRVRNNTTAYRQIDLSGFQSATLEYSWLIRASRYKSGERAEISVWDGNAWQLLATYDGDSPNLVWSVEGPINLTPFIGPDFEIRIRQFAGGNSRRFYLNDIVIYGTPD